MTFTPDRRLAAGLACLLALAVPVLAAPGEDPLAETRAALARGDGIAAEIAGKRALAGGVERSRVAALIGEAELMQGDFRGARDWLAPGAFDNASWERGFHALALVELASGDGAAAARAFDRALEKGEGSAELWVDIGRMRYRAGEHRLALQASLKAIARNGESPRALQFRAQLVRDASGLVAALPWLEKAVEIAPEDRGLLGEYAATLGEAGRMREMLEVARRIHALDPGDPQAFFLQAVLAARAGKTDLARRLLWRTGDSYDDVPAGLLLAGVLELQAGNAGLAVEKLDELSRRQPENGEVRLLLGRALLALGEGREVIALLESEAASGDASPYLLSLLGRAYEQIGRRDLAAPFLDRAAQMPGEGLGTLPVRQSRGGYARYGNGNHRPGPVSRLRTMASEGRANEAYGEASRLLADYAGSADYQAMAGDAALLAGDARSAISHYRNAALIRRSWPLVRNLAAALRLADDDELARREIAGFAEQHPRHGAAIAELARIHLQQGDTAKGAELLALATRLGRGAGDPSLHIALAEARLESGDGEGAESAARQAFQLQRSSRRVTETLARILDHSGDEAAAGVLLAKARSLNSRGLAAR